MDNAADFLRRAKDCIELARKAEQAERPLLYDAADEWLLLARNAAIKADVDTGPPASGVGA